MIAVRPEAIVIGPSIPAGCGRGRGVVRSRSFLGSLTRLALEAGGTTLTVDSPGLSGVGVADTIEFGWRDEDPLALPVTNI